VSYEQITSVYSVSSNSFRNEFANLADLEEFQRSHEELLFGMSRSCWMHYVIDEILKLQSFPALMFLGLSASKGDQRIPYSEDGTTEGHYLVTFLSRERLVQVREQLSALIALARTDVSGIARPMNEEGLGGWSEDNVRSAALEDIVSNHPHKDPRVHWGEDGDTPWYLFTYLRTLQKLCLDAQANDSALVYVEMDGM